MTRKRILALGTGQGWHSTALQQACAACQCDLHLGSYESMKSVIRSGRVESICDAGTFSDFDIVLTRTMPIGSFEQITFRLAMLHELCEGFGSKVEPGEESPSGCVKPLVVNAPRALELAIDKFATLSRVAKLGFRVPDTTVTQSRSEALDAFRSLGGDCVVKPIFGGEGRGVMRLRDAELAWSVFAALDRVDSVLYVQQFQPPGGSDNRLFVMGDEVFGIKRVNPNDFRTNVAGGGTCTWFDVNETQREMALSICNELGLVYGAVDYLLSDDGIPCVIEVNAIPGWKGAQTVAPFSIAEKIISALIDAADKRVMA
ncbi:MAG: ATP-grasp domain-containing protein [Rubripirellula sp.]|nr:ATP-grasp domain-containing protein [Rubripirellula sp.]